MPTRISTGSRNAAVAAITALANGGTIQVRTGTQPATPETAASGVLLCTFTLANPSYDAPATGVAALATTPRTTTGAAGGDAGYFRVLTSGAVAVFDGTVGTSGQQLNLNTVTISVGVDVEITSGTLTMPAA